jgi:hypothetical protein
LEARATLAVFPVNAPGEGSNGLGVGHVALREAPAQGTARLGADAIPFSVTGTIQQATSPALMRRD